MCSHALPSHDLGEAPMLSAVVVSLHFVSNCFVRFTPSLCERDYTSPAARSRALGWRWRVARLAVPRGQTVTGAVASHSAFFFRPFTDSSTLPWLARGDGAGGDRLSSESLLNRAHRERHPGPSKRDEGCRVRRGF